MEPSKLNQWIPVVGIFALVTSFTPEALLAWT
jgi:hypothetical protein